MFNLAPGTASPCPPDRVITGETIDRAGKVVGHWRISLLTSQLARFEYSTTGKFTDQQTQLVLNRDFCDRDVNIEVKDNNSSPSSACPSSASSPFAGGVTIYTDHLIITYDGKPFSPAGLKVKLRQAAGVKWGAGWHYGQEVVFNEKRWTHGNLGGTARTLDNVDGEVELEPGILATTGCALVDDSASLIIGEDGWPTSRDMGPHDKDLYLFGYGINYQECLTDFFQLAGRSPLLPRWALGNWWSRYWRYDEQEYLQLMDTFAEQGIPLSVAVIDMDWHVTDIDPELGSGWTGYTWNKELFPSPARFLSALHERGLTTSLNVHPADGIRAHEAAYPEVAKALGLNQDAREPADFHIEDREFARAYFELVHHPLEEQGVDFWWLDWQQGTHTTIPGLDPLWMLNYLHYHDSARNGRRPLTFSRYAGLGSHRYPIGFSGDTYTTWESLHFQPYFTTTAANSGYFWWSHDIGGHMCGERNYEMLTRWIQFGTFSPINRLHAANSPFVSKQPWDIPQPYRDAIVDALRLRHKLIPYLYTAMWDSHAKGIAPIRPLYHDHPDQPGAYDHPNTYYFGEHMVIAPITSPNKPHSHRGAASCWLPAGTWYDFFTGNAYTGGHTALTFHRTLDRVPAFVRAGSTIALAPAEEGANAHPERLTLRVYAGEGTSHLIEDDGSHNACPTEYEFRVAVTDGQLRVRSALLRGTPRSAHVVLECVGVQAYETAVRDLGSVRLDQIDELVPVEEGSTVTDQRREVFEVLNDAEMDAMTKDEVWWTIVDLLDSSSPQDLARAMSVIRHSKIPEDVCDAILEVLVR